MEYEHPQYTVILGSALKLIIKQLGSTIIYQLYPVQVLKHGKAPQLQIILPIFSHISWWVSHEFPWISHMFLPLLLGLAAAHLQRLLPDGSLLRILAASSEFFFGSSAAKKQGDLVRKTWVLIWFDWTYVIGFNRIIESTTIGLLPPKHKADKATVGKTAH